MTTAWNCLSAFNGPLSWPHQHLPEQHYHLVGPDEISHVAWGEVATNCKPTHSLVGQQNTWALQKLKSVAAAILVLKQNVKTQTSHGTATKTNYIVTMTYRNPSGMTKWPLLAPVSTNTARSATKLLSNWKDMIFREAVQSCVHETQLMLCGDCWAHKNT